MACTDSNAEDIEDSITLDQKLDAQFDLYDLAREKMVKRVVDENGVVGRQDWEEWLIPEDKYQMTEDDIAELTARQLDEIEASRDASKSASKISLDLIRSDADEVERYCSELPKGGMLHIHPGGTRNEQTIEEILIEVNPTVDPATILSLANDGELTMLYDEEVDFLSNLPVQEYLDYGDADQQKIRALFSCLTTRPRMTSCASKPCSVSAIYCTRTLKRKTGWKKKHIWISSTERPPKM